MHLKEKQLHCPNLYSITLIIWNFVLNCWQYSYRRVQMPHCSHKPCSSLHKLSWMISNYDAIKKFFSQLKAVIYQNVLLNKFFEKVFFITFVAFLSEGKKIRQNGDGWLWDTEQAVDSITAVSEEGDPFDKYSVLHIQCKNCLTSWHTPLLTGLAGCWKGQQQSTDKEYLWVLMTISLTFAKKEEIQTWAWH